MYDFLWPWPKLLILYLAKWLEKLFLRDDCTNCSYSIILLCKGRSCTNFCAFGFLLCNIVHRCTSLFTRKTKIWYFDIIVRCYACMHMYWIFVTQNRKMLREFENPSTRTPKIWPVFHAKFHVLKQILFLSIYYIVKRTLLFKISITLKTSAFTIFS